MKTKIYTEKNISEAAETIKNGGLVAVPTETVYGLAGNGLDENAVKNIYEVKGRPAVKPLSLMVPDKEAIWKYCEDVSRQAEVLADAFWPGPLTIILKSRDIVPDIVRAGGKTVGLRCPDHPLTIKALQTAGVPFAAPSANPSGEESPKNAQKVAEYFSGKIDGIIDGGECGIGRESTIIDMSALPYKILRQGALSKSEIEKALAGNMKIIGITGGTGCGKTTALTVLKSFGAMVIDCDDVYHSLLESSAEMKDELRREFHECITNGSLDRKRLGSIVFGNKDALNKLNAITHRYVKLEVDRRLREYAMSGGTVAAVDAIELFSSGESNICQCTVGIISDRDKRIERIVKRDNISGEYAASRIDAQHPDEYFKEKCTYVLTNNGDLASFESNCNKLFKEILNNE
jgi:tRNA threonylcarbamoyl adenosine modification protein (Sua5/YciO/YrdC/YwlC family)/dephospho-CoA kinase